MTIFITGATGYLGSYVAEILLRERDEDLALLTRAKDRDEGVEKLWKALQLHMDGEEFHRHLGRVRFIPGDLTAPGLGIAKSDRKWLADNASSVLHIAASLNRMSEKACLNQNLRGTLSVIELAKEIHERSGLRRFSHVSTVAVAGERNAERVHEDEAIDWDRRDYDPYGRTKKFCEHMVRTLMPEDVALTFFRPSMVIGDSRFPETTQFDMIRATIFLQDLPIVPLRPDVREDIVNADWVGRAIATLHTKERTDHEIYHLSAGEDAVTAHQIAEAFSEVTGRSPDRFSPTLEPAFASSMDFLASRKARNTATFIGALFKVFWPYVTYDTVFDNRRAVGELGIAPTPFTEYCGGLYRFCKETDFRYPYRPLPPGPRKTKAKARAGASSR